MVCITDKGAVGDGKKDNTDIFQSVLDEFKASGGTLCVPAGKYLIRSLRLYSNTTLYLGAGAELLASSDVSGYPVISEKMIPGFVRGTRQGILFSYDAENITVKGEGVINGQGENWWYAGESDEVRPRTIQFINCRRVTISGIRIINSPCWTVHPIRCSNVVIHGISIKNPYDSPNTDGINPESCKNVHVSDCNVDVGDDCVTIKSGLERDLFQKAAPCENITVTNCTFVHGHGGIVIGSEMSGGVRNMTVSNCIFQNTERGIRIKTRRKRGGYIEDVLITNVIMDNVIAGITANMYYKCGASPSDTELFTYEARPIAEDTPYIKNITISNILMKNVRAAGIYFLGLPEQPVSDIKIMNADIKVAGCENGEDSVSVYNIKKSYGDGIYLKNVKNVSVTGSSVTAKHEKLITENIENCEICL